MLARRLLLIAGLAMLSACSSGKSLLTKYVEGDSKTKWSLICEKSSVSQEEYDTYLNNQRRSGNALDKWRVDKITEDGQVQGIVTYSVDATDISNNKKVDFQFVVHNEEGRNCIQFVRGARLVSAVASDFVNMPTTTSIAFLPLTPSDYYNYNLRDFSSQFYSTNLSHPGDTKLDSATVYIKKTDDPEGKIYEALRKGGAYLKGTLATYTFTDGISFAGLDDYQKSSIEKDLFYEGGKVAMRSGDSGLYFLQNPQLIEPQLNFIAE